MALRSALLLATLAAPAVVSAYTTVDVDQYMIKNIDPIVVPGAYKSHMHAFFGSDAVTKDLPSSAALQAGGCTTAANPNDLSAYWVPVLYHVRADGTHTPLAPQRFVAYYNFERDAADVAIPQNLSVVAGNARAAAAADVVAGSDLTWLCAKQDFDAGGKDHAQWPQSTCSDSDDVLQAVLWFPDCVDPATLETAYSDGDGACDEDAGMRRMPQLRFSIRYDVSSIGSWEGDPPLALACGTSSYCFHGDFINGWTEDAADEMLSTLTSPDKRQALSGDKEGSPCDGDAKDADPNGGTSDYETSLEMME